MILGGAGHKSGEAQAGLAGVHERMRRAITPASSSLPARFQQGVGESPTRPASWARGSVASRCNSVRMRRSMRSSSEEVEEAFILSAIFVRSVRQSRWIRRQFAI